ncbi:22088_t:CDS:2 [Dentiscutata erythropus]|uniref:22088_t:CDS:1 n=1 Tax=Dentiscutata erythropus TaxID=1348616 RepID=A0A9N9DFJ8_9GLOM|nr:22088_t:CDS:2 [Dentiscutata erythropus]
MNHVHSEVEAETSYMATWRNIFIGTSAIDSKNKLVPIVFAVCSIKNSNNWL